VEFGLVHLIDPRLSGLVAESRALYARRVAGRGPSSPEELQAIRVAAAAPAPSYPPAVVEVVRTGGRSVPARIHLPASGEVAGVFLEIHGGGFYLGSAAGSDVRNRNLAEALNRSCDLTLALRDTLPLDTLTDRITPSRTTPTGTAVRTTRVISGK
jgi:acetyl esterase/lipase